MQTSTINPIAVKVAAIEELSARLNLQAYDEYWGRFMCRTGEVFALFAKRPYTFPGDEKRCASELEKYLAKEERAGRAHQDLYEINGMSTRAIRFS
jgi:hypothetical protein